MSTTPSKPPSSFKTVSSLVQSQLNHNNRVFSQINLLQKIWQESLPKALVAHSKVAAVSEGGLIIYADSPVWANKLANNQQKVLKILKANQHKECATIQYLTIRVTPASPVFSEKSKSHRISEQASKCLNDAASSISNPELKEALLKLSLQTQPPDRDLTKEDES